MKTTKEFHWWADCLRLWWMVFAVAVAATPVSAQVDVSINQIVWKSLYGVRDDQLYLNGDPNQGLNATWLSANDDGDQLSNGSELAMGTDPFSLNSTARIKGFTGDAASLSMTFPTVSQKL